MTAGRQEDARAAQAMAKGEAAAAKHIADAQAQGRVAGSQMVVEQPATVDDVDVDWFGTGGTVTGVSPQPTSSPNVDQPTDNRQSQ